MTLDARPPSGTVTGDDHCSLCDVPIWRGPRCRLCDQMVQKIMAEDEQ